MWIHPHKPPLHPNPNLAQPHSGARFRHIDKLVRFASVFSNIHLVSLVRYWDPRRIVTSRDVGLERKQKIWYWMKVRCTVSLKSTGILSCIHMIYSVPKLLSTTFSSSLLSVRRINTCASSSQFDITEQPNPKTQSHPSPTTHSTQPPNIHIICYQNSLNTIFPQIILSPINMHHAIREPDEQ